jgi:shikimate dehydrogenase
MNRLGVIGWPVAHSRSPAIHTAALRAVGLGDSWHYQLLPIPPELFSETVPALRADGFVGVNVTLPHKEAALALATHASARASAIGAANTLIFEADGGIAADNTDAPALAAGVPIDVAGASVVIMGAGGSARAALWAMLDAGASDVRVWNRNRKRAQALCAELGGRAVTSVEPAQLLINCTPVGLRAGDTLEMLPLPEGGVAAFDAVADYVYSEHGAPLTAAAQAEGLPYVDGLELLVGQGALAFELFTGLAAPLEAMRGAVGLSSTT